MPEAREWPGGTHVQGCGGEYNDMMAGTRYSEGSHKRHPRYGGVCVRWGRRKLSATGKLMATACRPIHCGAVDGGNPAAGGRS